MIKRITLTEEHLRLIPFLFIDEEGDDKMVINKKHLYELGSHLEEDLAMILGYNDKAIKGTEEDPYGRAYPDDVENHILEIHQYMVDNLYYILSLILQFSVKGGLEVGTYKCKDNELIWEKELN